MSVEISVVVPIYNEEFNIDYLLKKLLFVLNELHLSYEIICVNDGSKDNSLKHLIEYHKYNPAIKVIDLSRNFGKEIALTSGIEHAEGNAVIPIDADLQDPPELIEKLIEKWQQGYDVVYATRRSRLGESWLKRFTANAFYKVASSMSYVPIPANTGDFRLLDRRVVDALKQMPERRRFMKGLFSWVGFKQTSIVFERQPRFEGKTTWNYLKLWNFALDGLTSFTDLPLRVWSYLGLLISVPSLIYAGYLIFRTLVWGVDLPGYASLMVAVLFLGGIQLISMGIVGEYLGRVYEESKQRPLYFIRDFYGFETRKAANKMLRRLENKKVS